MSVKILIADDHQAMRETLKTLLAQDKNLEVIGEAGNGKEAIESAKALHPDVVIMDIAMPVMNGIDATKILLHEMPGLQVIGLTMYSNHHFINSMMDAGASTVLSKDTLYQEILYAIRSVTGEMLN